MKRKFPALLLCLSLTTATCAQKINVPPAVTKAFNAKFPGATGVKWGKENAHEYEAEFKSDNTAVSANFGQDGSWKETETSIHTSDLPAAVMNAVKTKYPGVVINLAEKVEKPDKIYFELGINVNDKKKEVEITPDGKFI